MYIQVCQWTNGPLKVPRIGPVTYKSIRNYTIQISIIYKYFYCLKKSIYRIRVKSVTRDISITRCT